MEKNERYCSRCGAGINTSVRFCPVCGEKINYQNEFNQNTSQPQIASNDIKEYNIKNSKKFSKISKLGIIVGIVLIVIGVLIEIPSSIILNPEQYVGGDAYNYMIEASIKGGMIAAANICKHMYICTGVLIVFISLFKYEE